MSRVDTLSHASCFMVKWGLLSRVCYTCWCFITHGRTFSRLFTLGHAWSRIVTDPYFFLRYINSILTFFALFTLSSIFTSIHALSRIVTRNCLERVLSLGPCHACHSCWYLITCHCFSRFVLPVYIIWILSVVTHCHALLRIFMYYGEWTVFVVGCQVSRLHTCIFTRGHTSGCQVKFG
jgi:hypothetical protein